MVENNDEKSSNDFIYALFLNETIGLLTIIEITLLTIPIKSTTNSWNTS